MSVCFFLSCYFRWFILSQFFSPLFCSRPIMLLYCARPTIYDAYLSLAHTVATIAIDWPDGGGK